MSLAVGGLTTEQRAVYAAANLPAGELVGGAKAQVEMPDVLRNEVTQSARPVSPSLYTSAFTRNAASIVQGATGDFVPVGSNVPRIAFDDLGNLAGMRMEESWTQLVRNVSATGGAAATLPTYWNTANTSGYATVTVIGKVSEGGMDGIEVEFSTGTITANGQAYVNFETMAGPINPGVQGDTFMSSVYVKHVSGDLTQACIGNIGSCISEVTNVGTLLGGNLGALSKTGLAGGGNPAIQRASYPRTLSNASATGAVSGFKIELKTGFGTLSPIRFRLFWPNLEKSSKIHTVTTTTGAIPLETLHGSLSFGTRGVMVIGSGRSAKAASTGDQVLFQLDDGTESNCVTLRRDTAGMAYGTVVVAGVTVADAPLKKWANDIYETAAIQWDSASIRAVVGQSSVVLTSAGGPAVTQWRRGNNSAGTAAWNGTASPLTLQEVDSGALQGLSKSPLQVRLHDDFNRADASNAGTAPGQALPWIQTPRPSPTSSVQTAFILNGKLEAPSAAVAGTALVATYTGIDAGSPIKRLVARASWNNTPAGAGGGITLICTKEGVYNPDPAQQVTDYITGNRGHQGSVHAQFTDILAYVQYFPAGATGEANNQPVTITQPVYSVPHDGTIYQFGWRYLGGNRFVWELPAPIGTPCVELSVYSPEMASRIGNFAIFEHYFTSSQAQPTMHEVYIET